MAAARPEAGISVVIPAWNCREMVLRLIAALRAQTRPPGPDDEILVVDDGSSDGTGEAAAAAGARVVRHEANRGRVAARETGAREARHETLVFMDARVVPEPGVLEHVARLAHRPLMGVGAAHKHRSAIDRVFYCIRRRVYHPFEPQSRYGEELWLRPDAFDGRPKGLGLLVIDRGMFLACALEDKGQDVNDDTRLLRRIVTEGAPILRHTGLTFTYEHRQRWGELLRHTFFRGPKFHDYYLTPGGPLFGRWVAGWVLLAVLAAACLAWPPLAAGLGILLLVAYAGVCAWVSEDLGDVVVFAACFPPIAAAFIAGILCAQAAKLTGLRRLIRH